MGDLINLRQARKTRNRIEDAARAEQNRARHGRTKAQRASDAAAAAVQSRTLDQARIDPAGDPPAE